MSPATGLLGYRDKMLLSVHLRNFSPVDLACSSRNKTKMVEHKLVSYIACDYSTAL